MSHRTPRLRALALTALAPLLVAPALLGAGTAAAASGDLDPTFSDDD